MEISADWSDNAVLEELGGRLARWRIGMGVTQAELAERAGVGKRTLERMESGGSAQVLSMVKVLRALGLVEGIDRLVPDATSGPMELLRTKGKERKRASKPRKKKGGAEVSSDQGRRTEWKWGDEK